ncbi:MAG: 2-hydroxy-3-oxopropionate reductase [Candidatus Latescibacteria bacterium]|nr:2-hydroxy-3-oxopropionate reductase [Candidatus Latescibacterota bacterium]MDP7449541.1 2-hydroxy-3-oxopropionate reductase [Candidatus Latescibacterota bacterium]HJP30603.1 2-hydroxy-3-oxopropionate reductase [Candidatus Latescibacterota bacterium]
MSAARPTVGFIGLGTMGRPMACNVQAAGYPLVIVDFDPPLPPELIDGGAHVCTTNKAVASAAEIIVLMVPDTPDVETVLFADDGVAAGLQHGKTVIDMSSISPTATVDFARRINDLGCDYLDAPVSGGAPRAVTGELTIMVGGPQSTFDRLLPLLQTMGTTVTLIGTRNGDGQVCKVANQIIVGTTVQAVAEALLFASKAGADPHKVREALMGGAAASLILDNHGQRMLARDFDASFRAELQRKDLGLAVDAARDLGLVLPNATTAWQLYHSCVAHGDGDADHIAVLKVLERLTGHTLTGGEGD